MQFATQIGKLPYSWRIVGGTPTVDGWTAEIEIADADGIVHPVPDENGNPVGTFLVGLSSDIYVDNQKLIDEAYAKARNALWIIEAGNANVAFMQIVQQGYRRPL